MIITILGGAGFMGAGIVRDLLSDRAIVDIETVRLCDASRDKMEALATELGDPRIELVALDVTDPDALSAAISGADICINCVPTLLGFQMTIFEAALAARVSYVDLGGLGTYTVKQIAEHERFKAAGVTAVIGVGADPGMSNVICRAVADELDEIDKINLYWAAELTGDENPVLVPPYSVSTVLAEYAHPSTQFYDGKHVECAPMSGGEYLDLPEPWGRCEFMHSPHSEQLTVPLADGIREKGIKEFSWKLHLPHREHEAWVGLVKAGFGDFNEPVDIGGVSVKPLDVLNKVIERNIKKNAERIPAQESHEIHFAIGYGRKGGKPCTVRVEVVVSPDPLYGPYVDACTSMNGSIAAQLILKHPKKPGVYAPEGYFDVESYFPELEKRKFRISKTVS
ncbi:saccharopine dehydrogenase-like NADP-dependent oxidoreductase [Rhizobium subbaraonis]|uniref:Saccharopine dehydrogenase-like NADP-dependent oxidoreductase n=1 Tax=Rhizobium subbaraonis TaxID=908946 RepID=A0A285U1U7_9HYPH|nr:saccharopine dehydrogenase NADP-binding domain-containing protein [Rhizobium subbaraonis]SOC35799.1 saccharopine dehydrogenase-like NADP-dependent oxidoreductase [Rhizobium subbaraonis]